MAMRSDTSRRYRIILRDECGDLLAGLPGELSIMSSSGWTCILASVRDDSELYGLLERFQEFALHIVSLSELGADVLRPRSGPYDDLIATALDHGVSPDEIEGVLVALLPVVGPARVIGAASSVCEALGREAGCGTVASPAEQVDKQV